MRLILCDLWQVTILQTGVIFIAFSLYVDGQGKGNYRCDSISAQGIPTTGQCVEFPLCPRLLEFAKRPRKSKDDFRMLSQLTCGFNRDEPRICCPDADLYVPPAPDDTDYALQFPREEDGDYNGESRNDVLLGSPGVNYEKGAIEKLIPKLEDCGEPRLDMVTSTRIIGGSKAEPGEFPYLVLLYRIDTETDEEEYFCGGTILNTHYVLTAAHCILTNYNTTAQLAFILVGVTDVSQRCFRNNQTECLNERRYEVRETKVHPKYVYGSRDKSHDIALIRTAQPIELNKDFIRPVCLPIPSVYGVSADMMRGSKDDSKTTPVLGAGLVAGWGRQSNTGKQTSPNLKSVILPILSRTECQNRYAGQVKISEKQICAGGEHGRDTCVGDSGGPLLSPLIPDVMDSEHYGPYVGKMFQTGIISYGPALCAITGKPSVYTRVSSYIDWILDNMYL